MASHATPAASRKLQLADIADLRAYERERPEFRAHVAELKRRRRVAVGTFVSVVFENRETMRFQIQEMARVEKLITDEDIQNELDAYNVLVPERGQLCVSLFIELTSDEGMKEWLPKLVGIERHLVLRLHDGREVRAVPEEQHAAQLTRDDVTSAVHYLRFELTDDEVAGVAAGPVSLAIDHPAYRDETELADTTVAELLTDLRP
ncbi:MAG: DUF3501 family protein [Acidimicrobiia bacterium]